MRFLYVDRITELGGGKISGVKQFSVAEPLRFSDSTGRVRLCQGLVAEAIGQLASWLALKENQFTGRPVFLFADRIAVSGLVYPGQTVELVARIDRQEEDSFRFSGEAFVGGLKIQQIDECSGYFMDLAQMEDPEVCRERFKSLTEGGLMLDGVEGDPYPLTELIGVMAESSEHHSAEIKIPDDAPFFGDHFPRYPVTPIVVLNELISIAASKLIGGDRGERLIPIEITDVKIRSFVKPGETITVRLQEEQSHDGGHRVLRAELLRRERPILRGRYVYENAVGGIH